MAKTPSPSPKAEPAAVQSIPVSDSASAHAPFLYFEAAPAYGHRNGVIQVTLEALRLTSTRPGEKVITERVLVAHLRMNLQAATSLRDALNGALLLAQPARSETKN